MPVGTISTKGLMPEKIAPLKIENGSNNIYIYKICNLDEYGSILLELLLIHPTGNPILAYVKINRHSSQNQELKGVKYNSIGTMDVYIDKVNNYLAVKLQAYYSLSIRLMAGNGVTFNVATVVDETGLTAL